MLAYTTIENKEKKYSTVGTYARTWNSGREGRIHMLKILIPDQENLTEGSLPHPLKKFHPLLENLLFEITIK